MSKQYQHGESSSIPLGFVLLAQNPSGLLQALQVNNSDQLLTAVSGAGSGGTSSVDESTFTAGASAGTPIMVEFGGQLFIASGDASRNVNVNIAAGSITVAPVTSNTASAASQQTIGTTAGQVLAANSARKRLILQNCGTTVIKIVLGAGTPTQSNYHFALPPGGTTNDGSSPVYNDIMWTGAVQAISSAAGGLLQVAELT